MLSVDEARERVLAGVAALPAERVPLAQACGRVIAEEVRADLPVPPFANAAMDGYA
ncbi:MAG: molybdopterin molybdenumtransferase MoeA, partial [Armatimonadetes bacterium]|nr:molybdopterin molybdenumtransferase MoeA [Armatimonadota bacterium]